MGGLQARSVVSVLSPFALTTLYNVRTQLGLPSTALTQDLAYKFERLINAASLAIETYCDREFAERESIETYDGRGADRLVTRNWPITQVINLYLDPSKSFTTPKDPSTFAIVDDDTTIELLSGQFPSSRYSIRVHYKAGFVYVPADVSLACDLYVEWLYRFNEREDIGRTSRSKGDESINIEQGMPDIVRQLISKYKRLEFGGASPRSIINV